jgi:phosphoribosylaminoimidazole-succinocarboxamide synthase
VRRKARQDQAWSLDAINNRFIRVADARLIVASDGISAFGYNLTEGIPNQGRILTQIEAFWFNATKDIVRSHLIATTVSNFSVELQPFRMALGGAPGLPEDPAQAREVHCQQLLSGKPVETRFEPAQVR